MSAPVTLLLDSYHDVTDTDAPLLRRVRGGAVLVAAILLIVAVIELDVYISPSSPDSLRSVQVFP